MKKVLLLSVNVFLILLGGCVQDRDILLPSPDQPAQTDTLRPEPGMILLNEFVAKGSANSNEFGTQEDWIELYNPRTKSLFIPADLLYITDDASGEPLKYAVPSVIVPARGFLLLWCDDLDTVAAGIHTNFKLSSTGDHPGLSVHADSTTYPMDEYQYGPQTIDAASNGRSPDGSPEWILFNTPTPGEPNL